VGQRAWGSAVVCQSAVQLSCKLKGKKNSWVSQGLLQLTHLNLNCERVFLKEHKFTAKGMGQCCSCQSALQPSCEISKSRNTKMGPQNQNSRLLQLTHLIFVRLCKCFTNSSSTLVWVWRREWGSAAVDNQRYSRVASTRQGPRILGWMTPPTYTPNFYGFAFACAKA